MNNHTPLQELLVARPLYLHLEVISRCAICQAHKVLIYPTIPTITPFAFEESHPFQNLSMDLITNLLSINNFNSVMVVVNHGLSKVVILAPCSKTEDATGIAKLFFKMSSNGPVYMKRLCEIVDPNLHLPLLES